MNRNKETLMLFAITSMDKPGALSLRMASREKHLAYTGETGAAKIGGPFLDEAGNMAGSFIIIEAADMAAAKAWAENDPYARAGVFVSTEIKPWRMTVNYCGANL
jgi:uncharacterized protein YciI